jgi:hypothetical protein
LDEIFEDVDESYLKEIEKVVSFSELSTRRGGSSNRHENKNQPNAEYPEDTPTRSRRQACCGLDIAKIESPGLPAGSCKGSLRGSET